MRCPPPRAHILRLACLWIQSDERYEQRTQAPVRDCIRVCTVKCLVENRWMAVGSAGCAKDVQLSIVVRMEGRFHLQQQDGCLSLLKDQRVQVSLVEGEQP